jgi:hypothetical protein
MVFTEEINPRLSEMGRVAFDRLNRRLCEFEVQRRIEKAEKISVCGQSAQMDVSSCGGGAQWSRGSTAVQLMDARTNGYLNCKFE